MRIIFTGSSGTGKTTLLNMFKDQGWPVITEVVRDLVKTKGIKINEQGTEESQWMIWNEYVKRLSEDGPWISDRGLTDVISYTKANRDLDEEHEPGEGLWGVYTHQSLDLNRWVKKNQDIIYVYFPIEFKTEDDGFRSLDEEYRQMVSENIEYELKSRYIPYLTVHGGPEERFKQIQEYIKSK